MPISITIRNKGAYIARCSISYSSLGVVTTHKSENLYAGQEELKEIPKDASNIQLKVENMVLIADWRTLFEGEIIPTVSFCLNIAGTTFHPTFALS